MPLSALRRAWRRLAAVCRAGTLDDELDEELRAHVAMATDELVDRGVPRREAARRARAMLGGVAAARARHRAARGLPWLEGLLFDVRLACRGLWRDWRFTVAACAMLALALTLNTTLFTVMDAMLFRGFPYVKDNGRILYIQEHYPASSCCVSYADFEDWRGQAQSFDALAFVGSGARISVRGEAGPPVDLSGFSVSANLFGVLGVPPLLGRDFTPADEVPGAPRVAIITHRLWERRFQSRPDVIGLALQIDDAPATIVGVMPAGFDFPSRKDLWIPATRSARMLQRGLTPAGFVVVGRLRHGVSVAEARAELATIADRLEKAHPDTNRGLRPTAMSYSRWVSGADAATIWGSLWVGACFVLLIACANAANLTLVRTVGRWRELTTRLALGAGRARMVRQLLLESVMLVTIAAATALWSTAWCVDRWADITYSRFQVVDYRVTAGTVTYLVVVALVAGLLVALAPITRVVQLGTSGALRGDARGVTANLRGKHLAAGLVAGQMALAVVLLGGAGVLLRSFQAIVSADSGVPDPANVLVGLVRLPSVSYPDAELRRAYFDRLDARLQTLPGIDGAALTNAPPTKSGRSRPVEVGDYSSSLDAGERVQFVTAGPEYFRVVGLGPVAGRVFTAADTGSSRPVALVNEAFAARYWPGESVVGKRLRIAVEPRPDHADVAGDVPDSRWRVVVGMVPNIMYGDALRQQFKPLVYLPFQQDPTPTAAYFLVRPQGPVPALAPNVREAVEDVDTDVSLDAFSTLEASFAFDRDSMDADHSELGKYSTVAPVFAGVALLLAGLGLVAVLAHWVGQRTREIGIRMALGAAARDIVRLIVGEGMRPVVWGLGVGLVATLAVNRVLQSQLVGVPFYDPLSIGGAAVMLILAALLACRVPAARASRVDPAVTLRHE